MSVDLRCRLTQGDIGPFTVARTLSVQAVKEQLLRRWPQGAGSQDAGTWWPARQLACVSLAWPTAALRQCAVCERAEGPLRAEQPGSSADLKLILGGKFLDNGDMLEGV